MGIVGVGFLVLSATAAGGTLTMSGVALSGVHATLVALVCVVVGLKNMVRMYLVWSLHSDVSPL